jgi:hypothetical protein
LANGGRYDVPAEESSRLIQEELTKFLHPGSVEVGKVELLRPLSGVFLVVVASEVRVFNDLRAEDVDRPLSVEVQSVSVVLEESRFSTEDRRDSELDLR